MTQYPTFRVPPPAPRHTSACWYEPDEIGWRCAESCPERPRLEALARGEAYRRPGQTDEEYHAYLAGWLEGHGFTVEVPRA